MIYWYAIALGTLQGIAEFLPISSSGHVLLGAEWLSRFSDDTALFEPLKQVEFNLAVHIGTFGSIVVVYARKLLANLTSVQLWSKVAIATAPLVVVGLLFKDVVEAKLEDPSVVGYFLLLTALFLTLLTQVERRRAAFASDETQPIEPGQTSSERGSLAASGRTLDEMTWLDALITGLFQCVAIFPGVSRSGTTIFAGTLAGMNRVAAADFSFFIALPAIGGAAVLHTKDLVEQGAVSTPVSVLVVGAVTAFLVGIAALRLLLALVAKGQLWWFAVYCGVLGCIAIATTR